MKDGIVCFAKATEVGLDGCRKCSLLGGTLQQYIHEDGRYSIRWVCAACGDYSTSMGIAFELARPFLPCRPYHLRICRDNRENRVGAMRVLNQNRCLICGQPFSELHHWAPRSIFPDWPENIVAPLCPSHHSEWHTRMRAHGLRWPSELEAVA